MADLEFERRMNPWLFDSSGSLTDQAKQQFPDLAEPLAPVALTGGGGTLSVQPAVLTQVAQQASVLQETVKSECDQPWQNVTGAVGALTGWDTSGALNTAWSVWSQQVQALSDAMGRIAQNLKTNADSYLNHEQANQRRFLAN
ncbi:WXG100 family type VII secretion target [Kitasatospora kifunensis]|uniref:Uncharacterized protein YukE n=1 Tax=Kitasatospora kifunensis TaxID=58351 RepID=A0A7W7R150_KITKI|nr:type VII secretion target [Kitasatospora kifunensis]MBB4923492.1 uncharacterized protein YukE [Kitasatospora kifunensis]